MRKQENYMDNTLGDWRLLLVTRLAKDQPAAFPGGPTHKAGTPVHLATATRGIGNQPIGFVTPSSTALALNIAMKASLQAMELYQQISFDDVLTPEGPGKSVGYKNAETLFDFFELCMTTVTFSFQALETFSNWIIAERIQEIFTIRRDKKDETFSIDEIERKLSTEEKLHLVLPRLFRIQSPKGRKCWGNFKELKHARDSIIHLKSTDQYPNRSVLGAIDKDSLYFVFLNNRMTVFPKAAIAIIHYFFSDSKEMPRWLEHTKNRFSTLFTGKRTCHRAFF
jgi:hypothetical protein